MNVTRNDPSRRVPQGVTIALLTALIVAGGEVRAQQVDPCRKEGPRPERGETDCRCGDRRASRLAEPVPGLRRAGSLPLPAAGPDADGFFHPEPGYTEGGYFELPVERPEWRVESRRIRARAPAGWVRACQWNVERGRKLPAVLKVMKELNCDLWFINEADFYGRVSGGKVVAREMARALGFFYFAGVEFHELRDDRRGSSGNAILSRYRLTDPRRMDIPIFERERGYDWSKSRRQPRCGQRSALSALAHVPDAWGETVDVRVVTLHTENMSPRPVRLLQFEAVRDALTRPGEPTILAGDLNTIELGESTHFGSYLVKLQRREGAGNSFVDCGRGRLAPTAWLLRLDWLLLQPGSSHLIQCSPKRYEVVFSPQTSDHHPILAEIFVRGRTDELGVSGAEDRTNAPIS